MPSESKREMFILSVRSRVKATGEIRNYRYSCWAASLDAAIMQAQNMINVDPRQEFISAIQTRIKK